MASIKIPDSVTSIGEDALKSCTALTDIYFGGTKAQWNAIKTVGNWNADSGNYTVHCTDGDIPKA